MSYVRVGGGSNLEILHAPTDPTPRIHLKNLFGYACRDINGVGIFEEKMEK